MARKKEDIAISKARGRQTTDAQNPNRNDDRNEGRGGGGSNKGKNQGLSKDLPSANIGGLGRGIL